MRTLAEAQEEYEAVRAAYLKALKAESYSLSSGAGSRSVARSRTGELRKQMNELAEEISRLSAGGIRVVGGTPV